MVPAVVDFETAAIEDRPRYPPVPVGVSIALPGRKARYYAWGHPTKNNCTKAEAKAALAKVWALPNPVLFHHSKFDLDVAETHMGMPMLPWDRVHDTLYLLFLHNPHERSLQLKPSAERLLGLAPTERDAVYDWLAEHEIIPRPRQTEEGLKYSPSAGAFISQAPGKLVADYANGDVDRTRALFVWLMARMDAGMLQAYDRERRLMPILLANERRGIRVDTERLGTDLAAFETSLITVSQWLFSKFGSDSINLDADDEVADALDRIGAVKEWVLTPKSKKRSVSKKNVVITDREVSQAIGYRNRLVNVLSQSLRPWASQAAACKGYITTEWNQVRQAKGSNDVKGARTGRLSCSRFMNITKDYEKKGDGYVHPPFMDVARLPRVREYLLPDEGGVWVHRDYSQQEFRILAHYEEGAIYDSYQTDPHTDYHVLMQARIEQVTGSEMARDLVKTLNFGILYGMGAGLLAERGGWTVSKATNLRNAVKRAAPGIFGRYGLEASIKERVRAGEPVREWGGGLIHCEEPVVAREGPRKGETITFDYKVLNHLIQRSAASCTKEAIIRYHAAKPASRMLVTVHDEVNVSAPAGRWREENELLRSVMESIEFDVKMLSEGKVGPSWGSLKKVEAA